MCFGIERRGSASEGWERIKKGPEYEVKYHTGDAARESAPRSQSGTLWKHASVMEDPDVLSQVV